MGPFNYSVTWFHLLTGREGGLGEPALGRLKWLCCSTAPAVKASTRIACLFSGRPPPHPVQMGHLVGGQCQAAPPHPRPNPAQSEMRETHTRHEGPTGRRAVLAWGNQKGFSKEVAGELACRATSRF